jgi:hypothetical protein
MVSRRTEKRGHDNKANDSAIRRFVDHLAARLRITTQVGEAIGTDARFPVTSHTAQDKE